MSSTEGYTWVSQVQWLGHSFFLTTAFLAALFPTVIKMYETSHWFRGGDPSKYDDAKEWFSNPQLPFSDSFDSPKVLMRVYFFIVPYILCACLLAAKNLIPKPISKTYERKMHFWLVVQSILGRTICLPKPLVMIGSPRRVTIGEVIGVIIFLFLNLGTFVVRVHRSLPRGSRKLTFLVQSGAAGKELIDVWSWQACEIWAKTLGVLSILNLGWYLLIPIGRRSFFLEALGLPWERMVKYHRWIGYYSVLLMLLHGVMYIAVWIHGNGHPEYDTKGVMLRHNLAAWGCPANECSPDQQLLLRINMYGIVCLLLILTMTGSALTWVRRHKFEWFYYLHHLFILVLLFVCLHYRGSVIYLIPGITVYGVDKLLGLLAYQKTVEAEAKLVSSDVLEVTISLGPGVSYKGGQYIFLNVPAVSFLEWHPFSITSAPNIYGDKIVFHLKAAGDWTQKVVEAAMSETSPNKSSLQVRLDGFYGHNANLDLQYKNGAIFVGGGIGVTPMMSMAMDLCQTQKNIPVTLLWVVRTVEEFNIFAYELCQQRRRFGSQLVVKVWITLSSNSHRSITLEDGSTYVELSKLDIANLKTDEQCTEVIAHLQTLNGSKSNNEHEGKDNNRGSSSPAKANSSLVMENAGLGPAANAFVMCLAIIFGLTAYAFSQKIDNDYSIEPVDKLVLLDLSLVIYFLIAFLTFVEALRRVVMRFRGKENGQKNDEEKKSPKKQHDAPISTRRSDTSNISNDDKNDAEMSSLNDNHQSMQDIIHEMIIGRIGCRPDVSAEFLDAAAAAGTFYSTQTKKNSQAHNTSSVLEHHPSEIGVLACGPVPLIESINSFCNQSSCFSWGVRNDDGSKVFFAFTEDDWEW